MRLGMYVAGGCVHVAGRGLCDESPGYACDIRPINSEETEIHGELLCAQLTTVWLGRHARFAEIATEDCPQIGERLV